MKALMMVFAVAMLLPTASEARGRVAGAAAFGLSRVLAVTDPQGKVYGASVLTPEALAQCIANEEALNATSVNLESSTTRLEAQYVALQRGAQPAQAQNFRLAVGLHDSELRRFKKNVASFNRECTPKSYYADDYAAAADAAKRLSLSLSQ